MITIKISDQFRAICPDFVGVALFATIRNNEYDEILWQQINRISCEYKNRYSIEDIKKNKAIAATRNAYKRFGKDPNRYRPSAEALCRRILRELPLYQINTLVDLINMVSIQSGFSIGGFDTDKIEGNIVTLGIGDADEPYEAIGRGMLNIEGLPVYRDAKGGIGTPTSDNERTKLDVSTTHFLTIINGYNGQEGLAEASYCMRQALEKFVEAINIEEYYF